MGNLYGLGRQIEELVVATMAIFDWYSTMSPGSRGPVDVYSVRSRVHWCLQVKFRDTDFSLNYINNDFDKILQHSSLHQCTPVFAFVGPMGPTGILGTMKRDTNYSNVIRHNDGSMYGIQMGKLLLQLYDLKQHVMLDPLRKVKGQSELGDL